MLFVLNKTNTIGNQFLAELRDVNAQQDRLRFRRNQERLGEILAYEISKKFKYVTSDVQTPLGIASINMPETQPVLATILRAGLPLPDPRRRALGRVDAVIDPPAATSAALAVSPT